MSTGRPRRALWVVGDAPDRNGAGNNIRQAHLLTALGHELPVDLLTCGEPDPVTRAAVQQVTVVPGVVRQRRQARVSRRLEALAVASWAGPEEVWGAAEQRRNLAKALADSSSYDLVCIGDAAFAPMVRARRSHQRWAILLQNIASSRGRQQRDVTSGRRQRWALAQEVRQAEALERWIVRHYDTTICVSDLDASMLHGGSVVVVANGVDTGRFPDTPLPAEPRVLFLGALMTPPNEDGAIWLTTEIWPRVRAHLPAATLSIVGQHPTPRVLALDDVPGVSVVGDPADVTAHLLGARVVTVPLRMGSGTRLKALEGMAARRPVVGTSIGLEGLHIEDGVNATVADDPGVFADEVIRLLKDDTAASRQALAGRRLAEQQYDWSFAGRALTRALLPPGG